MASLLRLLRRLRAYAPALLACAVIGGFAVWMIVERAGRLAVPLDDAFIHLNYARRLAEGHFFEYTPGRGFTSGATSPLWAALIAPFYALGLRGLSLIVAPWLLGLGLHAAVVVETKRLAEPLTGLGVAIAAGAMAAVFGAFAWFAYSGMETLGLAWVLMRTARVGAEHAEGKDHTRQLIALALLGPLVRPEAVLVSLIAAGAISMKPKATWRERAWALLPLGGPLIVPLINLGFTGHTSASTTTVKWLLANPYYDMHDALLVTAKNARMLVTDLLNGDPLFLPENATFPIVGGFLVLPIAASRRGLWARGAFIAVVALGVLIPCTYSSFLWNRLRYLWPFAGAWFVGIACLAREIGDLFRWTAARLRQPAPWTRWVSPLLAFSFVGALGAKLPAALRDLAQSARAIDHQQVKLGLWARKHLPPTAVIGVNDTGAIAYLSDRPTFDVVGLTTEGEARYWVAGAGSRFEHYERLGKEELPTHFIVYPHWMAMPALLGRELTRATVKDQSILGGQTMVAYEANYGLLGSGERPLGSKAEPVDAVDVGDLDSEGAHAFELGEGDERNNRAEVLTAPSGREIADGSRGLRTRDRFRMRLQGARRLVCRLNSSEPMTLTVTLNDDVIGTIDLGGAGWSEYEVSLPDGLASDEATIDVGSTDESPAFVSYHYWAMPDRTGAEAGEATAR